MKIFFNIAYFYPSQKGGPANSIYWLAKALTSNGIQCTIVATDTGIKVNTVPIEQWIQTEAGSVIYKKEINYTFWPKLIWESLFQIRKSDIIHLTSLFAFPSLIVGTVSVIMRKKIIWSTRGELNVQALLYSNWKKRPVLFLVRNLLSKNVTFHSTSPEETKHIQDVFGIYIKVIEIPNLMDLPVNIQEKAAKENPYSLYIGRIHPIKALGQLINALSISSGFIESTHTFIIAGNFENEYGTQLQNLIKSLNLQSKISFIGQVEGEEKQHLYANAYFTFLPSHTENFGNVVVESLAQGTPVVASTGTPWEILPEYNAGYWVKNSTSSLSETIDSILALTPEKYSSMRQNARQLCENKFDINKNIDKWINIYSTLLHG